MSNHKRARTAEANPKPVEWLRCPDCASTVHEVWAGEAPKQSLALEIEHSPTCPAWRHDGREPALAFLPPADPAEEGDSS